MVCVMGACVRLVCGASFRCAKPEVRPGRPQGVGPPPALPGRGLRATPGETPGSRTPPRGGLGQRLGRTWTRRPAALPPCGPPRGTALPRPVADALGDGALARAPRALRGQWSAQAAAGPWLPGRWVPVTAGTRSPLGLLLVCTPAVPASGGPPSCSGLRPPGAFRVGSGPCAPPPGSRLPRPPVDAALVSLLRRWACARRRALLRRSSSPSARLPGRVRVPALACHPGSGCHAPRPPGAVGVCAAAFSLAIGRVSGPCREVPASRCSRPPGWFLTVQPPGAL